MATADLPPHPQPYPSPPHSPHDHSAPAIPENSTYVTLITGSSYLPGALLLAHSLRRHGSKFSLLVLITPSLPASAVHALTLESHFSPLLRLRTIDPLYPPPRNDTSDNYADPRFRDTYTKLRAFSLTEFHTVVFLDADMLVRHNPDSLFHQAFPAGTELLASPVCACNLDNNKWVGADWNPFNCGHTILPEGGFLQPVKTEGGWPLRPWNMLNSGVLVFRPSLSAWTSLLRKFSNDPRLYDYPCPDQDFLSVHFNGRWGRLDWRYNAIKTMRYWHGDLWSGHTMAGGRDVRDIVGLKVDKEVVIVHHIVDKPWNKRIACDGIAGHLGRDGVTHRWWWDAYEDWRRERKDVEGSVDARAPGPEGRTPVEEAGLLLGIVEKEVAPELDEEEDRKQREQHRKNGWPLDITEREGMSEGARRAKDRIRDFMVNGVVLRRMGRLT